MNKVRTLYKAFGSNLEMPKPDKENKVKAYRTFGAVAFLGIMVPVSVLVGYITYVLTDFLFMFSGNTNALLFELHLISAFAMIFGLPLIFSVMFFSSDLSFLTSLPLPASSLYAARFWHTFKAENVMTSNVLFAIYIGYFIAAAKNAGVGSALNPLAAAGALLGFFGSLFIPLLYCAILAMLMMRLLNRFNRTDIYYRSSVVLFVVFTAVFLSSFIGYGRVSTQGFLDSLVSGRNAFTMMCNFIFPTNYLTTITVREHSVLPLLGASAICVALYFLSVLTARLTYQDGLFAAAVLGKHKAVRKVAASVIKRSVFSALVIKEFKVLTRTLTYRMNCLYSNLIWPVAAVIFVFVVPSNKILMEFNVRLRSGEAFSNVIMIIAIMAVSFIASGLNSIASTSFTREGVQIDLMKYLPTEMKKQILAKLVVAVVCTYVPLAVTVIVVSVSLRAALMIPLYLLVSLLSVIAADVVGLLMDSFSPYTVWSDELSALRGNLNCFFNLAAELIAAVIAGGAACGIFILTGSYAVTLAVVLIILVILVAAGLTKGLSRAGRNIETLS